MMLSSIPANLIRQWCYCPRVVYYAELTDWHVVYPAWVQQGTDFHQQETLLWRRRNLSRFGLQSGMQHHNLTMKSKLLGLHGIADMVVETADAVYPIEFKLATANKKRGDILQLIAYSMLAEQHFEKPSSVGFLVGKGRVLHQIKINQKQCQQVIIVADKIRAMLAKGYKPQSSASLAQCGTCEYVNFCNDRL